MKSTSAAENSGSKTAMRRSLSKLMRRTHLFLALFLTPWITMYAISTLVMHHREFFTGHPRRVAPDFEVIDERPYDPRVSEDESPRDVARRILKDLGISGAHSARGDPRSGRLTIERHRAIGSYRVTYDPNDQNLTVERQRFGLAFFLEMLHRRRGFQENHAANLSWGLIVDVVIGAIVLWAVTGLWMWMGLSRTRKLGTVCLAAGSALFSFLLLML